jgi:adenylate cyclase
MERRLAAILAADVVGYSALMERDEAGAFSALKASREELFEPEIAKHRGRIFKLMGDGLLAEFASAVDAVECAIALHRGLAERNNSKAEPKRFSIRIGINLGEVIIEGEDRHGEGVNVAARLEQIAVPGAVYISGKVATEIEGKLTVGFDRFEDLGFQQLKNITQMVHVFRLQIGDSLTPFKPPSLNKPTVLVLPFTNQSGDDEQEYFADGITEDIILELGKFHELAVIACTSSLAYKGKYKRAKDIGTELGASYVVEGSVRRAADNIRIAVQLWNTSTGSQLWAERYDRGFQEVFAVQDELTRRIVSSVMGRVVQADYQRALPLSSDQLAAYDCWLRGQHLMLNWTPEADHEGLVWFEKAIEKNPNFARAHASIATLLNVRILVTPGYGKEREDRVRALHHARLAVEHDPDDARCHHALGWIYTFFADLKRAKRHFKLAVDLNPNAADTIMSCALGLAYSTELSYARELASRAMELNPLHADWYYYFLCQMHFIAGEYDQAYETGHPYNELFPENGGWTTAALALSGRVSEAIEEGKRFVLIVQRCWVGEQPVRTEDAIHWFWLVNHYLPKPLKATLLRGLELAELPGD